MSGDRIKIASLATGQLLTGPQLSEPMRVETVQANGSTSWVVGLVGLQSERFRNVNLSAADLTVLLTPNERRVAQDRRDCYWLYVVTHCETTPRLQDPIGDPARLDWHEVTKIAHYYLSLDAITRPMQVREDTPPYGERS